MLLVSPGFPPELGGIERHVSRLATGLIEDAGWEVTVATFAGPDAPYATGEVRGAVVHRFPLDVQRTAYRWSGDLRRWLAEHHASFDVVHVHGYHSLPALAAAAAKPAAWVFTPHYHGTGHTPVRRVLHRGYRPAGRWLMRRAGAVVCVSEAEAALVTRHFPGTVGRVSVIPNGVDQPDISVPPMSTGKVVVLSSGRLEEYKGVEGVVQAAQELEDRFTIVITGEGPQLETLRRLVERLEVAGRVQLMGNLPLPELQRWQRSATVYVTLSTSEAFNLGAYEAASAGARIVASDIPAHREMLHRLLPGSVALVPTRPAPAALARVIESSAGLGRMGDGQPVPSWTDGVARTVEVYQAVLDQAAATAAAISSEAS